MIFFYKEVDFWQNTVPNISRYVQGSLVHITKVIITSNYLHNTAFYPQANFNYAQIERTTMGKHSSIIPLLVEND